MEIGLHVTGVTIGLGLAAGLGTVAWAAGRWRRLRVRLKAALGLLRRYRR